MGKEYNRDDYINKPLYNIIVLFVYLIIVIYIVILINSLYNISKYGSNETAYIILNNDEESLKNNITENYHYRTLNYINCFNEDDDIDKDKDSVDILKYILNLFSAINKFYNEKDFTLLLEYNLYNIMFKIILLIIFLVFLGIIINLFIEFFLKKTQHNITGNESIFQFIKKGNNDLIITLTVIFLFAILIYLAIYKFYFIDVIYDSIYEKYLSILLLDRLILHEAKKINKNDSNFFVILKNIVIKKNNSNYAITEDYESYIKENIEETEDSNIKISKYFILGFYKYVVSISNDSDIVTKLNNYIIRKNDNLNNDDNIALRDFLPIEYVIDPNLDTAFEFKNISDSDASLLLKKQNELKNILNRLDDKLNDNQDGHNIMIYISILIVVNFFIVMLLSYFIYKNDYDQNSGVNFDKDNNFKIIKDILVKIIEYIKKMYNKLSGNEADAESVPKTVNVAVPVSEAEDDVPEAYAVG